MAALHNHLEQISTCAASLGDLEFPPSKIFTNALLGNHEITTLIRDTEPHERALFSIDSNATSASKASSSRRTTTFGDASSRRKTMHSIQSQSSAVARVLGNDMLRRIQQSSRGQSKRGVDVEILLQGAERLCAVYSVAGTMESIAVLRHRYNSIRESITEYEAKVAEQQGRVHRINSGFGALAGSDEEFEGQMSSSGAQMTDNPTVPIDLHAEAEEIRELEAKKRALEERVAGMEKDLGGLLQ